MKSEKRRSPKMNKEFLGRMKKILGEEYEAYENSFSFPAKRGISVNLLKTDPARLAEVIGEGLTPLPYGSGYIYEKDKRFGKTPYYNAGAFYMQDPSAMLPVAAYPPEGGRVLDLCAAPGGKSLQAASLMKGRGLLVCNEINLSRAKILMGNLERAGVKNAVVTCCAPERLADMLPGYFDMIYVDAPCSGEGMFRKNPEAEKEWDPSLPKFCAERQRRIVREADVMLKEGGVMVYSTCTFSPEENEEIAEYIIETGYDPVSPREETAAVTLPGLHGMRYARRSYPFCRYGEGQFFAGFVKRGFLDGKVVKEDAFGGFREVSAGERGLFEECFGVRLGKVGKRGEDYFLLPECELPEVLERSLVTGVRIGKSVKGRAEPHHAAFSALGTEMPLKLELPAADELAVKYLEGQELELSLPEGFGAVIIEGCALGGFKSVGGRLKNRYPKGLRNPQTR